MILADHPVDMLFGHPTKFARQATYIPSFEANWYFPDLKDISYKFPDFFFLTEKKIILDIQIIVHLRDYSQFHDDSLRDSWGSRDSSGPSGCFDVQGGDQGQTFLL